MQLVLCSECEAFVAVAVEGIFQLLLLDFFLQIGHFFLGLERHFLGLEQDFLGLEHDFSEPSLHFLLELVHFFLVASDPLVLDFWHCMVPVLAVELVVEPLIFVIW